MADFTALKTAIQNAIKQNGNEEITGNLLQEILLAIVTTLGDGSINELITALGTEATNREQADGTLQQNINAEATTRSQADGTLQQNINAEATTRSQADTALGGRIDGVIESINAINAAIGNGYVYAGIATPSSTPTTGKVFYLALTAGTYTNFGNTAVTQGINILKYNGSAWSLDAFVGIDDTPTPSSNNLIKSGGVLDSIIKDGSAFDLSAYNGGATYADLNAALTALNALPAAYKKGGMSMKYVQSSDNKYVQYRLMNEQWSLVTSDWAVNDDGVYIESPEFVYAWLGKNKDIILAFKLDGDVYFGAGVPQQIIEFITPLLLGKVDKISGKSLIDEVFADSVYCIENPEFVDVEIDSNKRIASYRDKEGIKHECVGFESPYIRTDNLVLSNDGLKNLSKALSLKSINRLPCLPQEIVDATGNDYVANRCQNCLVAHKSFKPLLDFRGRLAHKTVVQGSGRNYWQYNLTSEILFEERFTLRLDTGNYGGTRIYTKHSDNLKDWVTESVSSIFGTYVFINSESDSCYGNDNSLLITNERVQYYDGEDLKSAILPLWSLDGGLHFEPLINNLRGHFSIANNILNEGVVVTIGQKTYSCISSSDANTTMEALVGDNTDELVAAGLEYLADKIVISTNAQDALRMLAWHLVEEGYFVRLEDDELIVYSKTIGTAGNIQSDISIGNTTYSFAGGQDYNTTPQLVNAAQILPSTLPVTHSDGSLITSGQAWTYMSWLYIKGVWYMATDMKNTTLVSQVVVKISDITDAVNNSTYKVLMSQPLNYNTEPLLTYDSIHNIIFVGLRDDKSTNTGVIKYFYSTDGGDNYTMFTIENPSDNLSWKYNTKIFLAEPPNIFNGSSTNEGYTYPSSTYNLIYVSVVYCRATGIAWVATADIPPVFDKDISKLEWSEYKPLNHFVPKDEKDWKPVLGDFPDYRLRSYNSGMGSIGAMVYSRLYKGIVVGYQGMKVVGKQPSFCMGIAIEHC